jgi:pyruvate/2-oxoglutarate dehydrogenase complex dihydrolipoamide acyltransferase (E2) component
MKIQIERYNNNDDHVVVVEILGLNGKQVCEGDVLFLVETSKAVEEVLAPVGGIIKHNINLNDQLKVGVDCCEIVSESEILPLEERSKIQVNEDENIPSKLSQPEGLTSIPQTVRINESNHLVSKEAETIIGSNTIDLNKVGNRYYINSDLIRKIDMNKNIGDKEFKLQKFSNRKIFENKNLMDSNGGNFNSTISIEFDFIYRSIEPDFSFFSENISDILIFEGSRLITNNQLLNSFYIDDEVYGYYGDVNFGFAIDTDNDLNVYTIYNANKLDLTSLQRKIVELISNHTEKIAPKSIDVSNSTITLTDLTTSSCRNVIPLLNQRQSMILALTKFQNDSNNIFQINCTFDHRILSGKIVSIFLGELKKRMASHSSESCNESNLFCFKCQRNMKDINSLGYDSFVKVHTMKGEQLICPICQTGW